MALDIDAHLTQKREPARKVKLVIVADELTFVEVADLATSPNNKFTPVVVRHQKRERPALQRRSLCEQESDPEWETVNTFRDEADAQKAMASLVKRDGQSWEFRIRPGKLRSTFSLCRYPDHGERVPAGWILICTTEDIVPPREWAGSGRRPEIPGGSRGSVVVGTVDAERFLTHTEAARTLGVHVTRIVNFVRCGNLTNYKFKHLSFVSKAEVNDLRQRLSA